MPVWSKHRIVGALSILSVICLLGGCAGSPDTGRDNLHARISIDEQLRRSLITERPIVEANVRDTALRVSVPIRSVISEPLQIQYRFDFLNEDEEMVSSSHGWRFVRIDPRMPVSLDASARSEDAVDWRLRIRPAR